MKDKKLAKKFLRCLPAKYTAYKATISVSFNIDEFGFDEVVGMFRAHDMELDEGKKGKGISLVSLELTKDE